MLDATSLVRVIEVSMDNPIIVCSACGQRVRLAGHPPEGAQPTCAKCGVVLNLNDRANTEHQEKRFWQDLSRLGSRMKAIGLPAKGVLPMIRELVKQAGPRRYPSASVRRCSLAAGD